MSPRKNKPEHGRRRLPRPPDPEQTQRAVSLEALAQELVRRGRATPAILDRNTPNTQPKEHR